MAEVTRKRRYSCQPYFNRNQENKTGALKIKRRLDLFRGIEAVLLFIHQPCTIQ